MDPEWKEKEWACVLRSCLQGRACRGFNSATRLRAGPPAPGATGLRRRRAGCWWRRCSDLGTSGRRPHTLSSSAPCHSPPRRRWTLFPRTPRRLCRHICCSGLEKEAREAWWPMVEVGKTRRITSKVVMFGNWRAIDAPASRDAINYPPLSRTPRKSCRIGQGRHFTPLRQNKQVLRLLPGFLSMGPPRSGSLLHALHRAGPNPQCDPSTPRPNAETSAKRRAARLKQRETKEELTCFERERAWDAKGLMPHKDPSETSRGGKPCVRWRCEAGTHQPGVPRRRVTRSARPLWWLPNRKWPRRAYMCHHLCCKWDGSEGKGAQRVPARKRRAWGSSRDLTDQDRTVRLPTWQMGKLRTVTWLWWPNPSPPRRRAGQCWLSRSLLSATWTQHQQVWNHSLRM